LVRLFIRRNVSTARFVTSNSDGDEMMIIEPKHKPHRNDNDRDKRNRRHQEEALDDALKNTFPASDPVSIVLPAPPADRDR